MKSQEQLPIIVDATTVSVGEWQSKCLYLNRSLKEKEVALKQHILRVNGIELTASYDDKCGNKFVHQEITRYLGARFYYRLQSAIWNHRIRPILDHCRQYCCYYVSYRSKPLFYRESQILRMEKYTRLVQQAKVDGLASIIPLIIYFGSSPRVIKRRLGKRRWRRLCSHSLHKNKLLVLCFEQFFLDEKRLGQFRFTDDRIDIIGRLAKLQSSLLKLMTFDRIRVNPSKITDKIWVNAHVESIEWLSHHARVSNYPECEAYYHLFNDTRQMADQLKRPFNTQWSYKRMNQAHVKYMKTLRCQQFPDVPYQTLLPIPDGTMGDVRYQLLRSPYQLWQEGETMHHCVASYHEAVAKGHYLVFHLQQDTEVSTLGIRVGTQHVNIEQHVGVCNEIISSSKLKHVAKQIESLVEQIVSKQQSQSG